MLYIAVKRYVLRQFGGISIFPLNLKGSIVMLLLCVFFQKNITLRGKLQVSYILLTDT